MDISGTLARRDSSYGIHRGQVGAKGLFRHLLSHTWSLPHCVCPVAVKTQRMSYYHPNSFYSFSAILGIYYRNIYM